MLLKIILHMESVEAVGGVLDYVKLCTLTSFTGPGLQSLIRAAQGVPRNFAEDESLQ